MKKGFAIAIVVAAIGLLMRRLIGGGEGWEARLAKMPDASPPKWMFTNIAAIRDNTEAILAKMGAPVTG